MLKKNKFQLYSMAVLFAVASVLASGQVNLMTKATFGDWAEYT